MLDDAVLRKAAVQSPNFGCARLGTPQAIWCRLPLQYGKGGVVIGIVNEFEIPVRYIGLGEQVEDLRPFDAQQFTKSIFAE